MPNLVHRVSSIPPDGKRFHTIAGPWEMMYYTPSIICEGCDKQARFGFCREGVKFCERCAEILGLDDLRVEECDCVLTKEEVKWN